MLTEKQYQLLNFIAKWQESHQTSPSYEEMLRAFNLSSKSNIHRLLCSLEERGYIRRLPNRARAIEILKLPTEYNLEKDSLFALAESTLELPLYSKIAAGYPLEAIRDKSNTLSVPKFFIGKGRYFALQVSGNSMEDAGILDGDYAVIEYTSNPPVGVIVVALIDGEEATLKYLKKRTSEETILEPASQDYQTKAYPSERVKCQGKLVGIMRAY